MDPKGLSRAKFFNFLLDRPLNEEEMAGKLNKKKSFSNGAEVKDLLSVIKINDCYMEMVDRWYSHKGEAVFYGVMIMMLMSLLYIPFAFALYQKDSTEGLPAVIFFMAFGSACSISWVVLLSFGSLSANPLSHTLQQEKSHGICHSSSRENGACQVG